MNNQHAGLSQVLAEQRMTQRRQATHARLVRGARPPRRRRRWAVRGWWQLARWPSVAANQPVHAGLTAVAQAHATEQTINQYASPPLEPHAGESDRHRQAASQQQTAAAAALRRVLAREHLSVPSGTPAQVPEEPSGQPGWLVASLGGLAAALALIVGWPCWPPDGHAAGLGLGTRPDHRHGRATRWGCRAHRQPHRPPTPSAPPASST